MRIKVYYRFSLADEIPKCEVNAPREIKKKMLRDVSWGTGTDILYAALKSTKLDSSLPWRSFEPVLENHGDGSSTDLLFSLTFDDKHFNIESEGVNHFLGTIAGDILYNRQIKDISVLDIEIEDSSGSLAEVWAGPNVGIEGLRNKLKGAGKRPFVAFSIKPRIGLLPDQYRTLCEQASYAGVDIVEDDERLVDISSCPFDVRAKIVSELINKGGAFTQFSLNITGPVYQMLERLKTAYDYGVRMVKVDVLVTGFDALINIVNEVRTKYKGEIAITSYPDISEGNYRKLSKRFILKLARICGVDIIYAGSPSWSRFGEKNTVPNLENEIAKAYKNHKVLLDELKIGSMSIKSTLPTLTNDFSGSRAEITTIAFKEFHGHFDFAFFVGGGISAHPSKNIQEAASELINCVRHASKYEAGKMYEPFDFSSYYAEPSHKKWDVYDVGEALNELFDTHLN